MPQPQTESIFERLDPPTNICSLCGDRQGPFTFEARRTGEGLSYQNWPVCSKCAALSAADADPLILAGKNLIFLRWLFARYRLRRFAGGPNGYRIAPARSA
jgi:hypothetical protein